MSFFHHATFSLQVSLNADLAAGTDCNNVLYLEEDNSGRLNDLVALKADLSFSQMPQTSTNLQLASSTQVNSIFNIKKKK